MDKDILLDRGRMMELLTDYTAKLHYADTFEVVDMEMPGIQALTFELRGKIDLLLTLIPKVEPDYAHLVDELEQNIQYCRAHKTIARRAISFCGIIGYEPREIMEGILRAGY